MALPSHQCRLGARYFTLSVIVVVAIALFVYQWLPAPPPASAAPLSATPALVFSNEEIPDSIALGESVDLEFQIGLRSGTGDHGGISFSFPDLTARGGSSSSYDSVQGTVTTVSYTNGSSHVAYFDEGDQIFKGNDANRSSAEYLLVESDDDDWPSRSGSDYVWRTLILRVTPKESGPFRIYSRFWLCGSGYEDCDRRPRPEHSDQEDQQRWSVYEDTVRVSGPTSGAFSRNSAEDFDGLDAAGNDSPEGIWSDGTTMWVADSSDSKMYAYNISNKARVSSKDFDTLDSAGNDSPTGIWSDGATMWVADSSDDKIYAYNMSDQARVSSKDFDTLDSAGNGRPEGIWSDGATMWVADSSDDKIYAYNMSDQARVSSKDFDTLEDAENDHAAGIWSDGATMWVADYSDDKIYAYNMSDQARVSSKDFDTLEDAENDHAAGIWSDRTTMWVADYSDEKIYAYNAPETAVSNMNRAPTVAGTPPTQQTLSLTTGDSQTFGVSATDADNNLTKWKWVVDKHFSLLHGHQQPEESFAATGSITKTFSHTFPDNGTYTVTVTFTDSQGDSGTAEWRVEVEDNSNHAPTVSRVPSSPSQVSLFTSDSHTFTVAATDADNNMTKWKWVVDKRLSLLHGHNEPEESFAATGSITKTFSHTFPDNGTYDVTATFTDSQGDSGTAEWRVEVEDLLNHAPIVSRVPSSPSQVSLFTSDSHTFTAAATDADNNMTKWKWVVDKRLSLLHGHNEPEESFAATGSITKTFSHTFPDNGTYDVTATFTDSQGDSGSVSWTVEVTDNRAPTLTFSPPTQQTLSLTTGDSQTFGVSATDADNNMTKWKWVVDKRLSLLHGHNEPEESFAATGSITKIFSHTFPNDGTYDVTATFTDSQGDSGSVSWTVEVVDPTLPTVAVTVGSDPSGLTVTVDGTDQTTPFTANWNSGSSHTLDAPSPQTVNQNVYVITGWSDGLAQSHSVSPTADTTYTANFALTSSGGTPTAEITSCGASPASPTVKDEWKPVAEVTNHSYMSRLHQELYVEFTISDPTRGLELAETKSTTQTRIPIGNSYTFEGQAASWPEDDKEQRVEDGSHQLTLFPLKWFPGEIKVECELKAAVPYVPYLWHVLVDEDTGIVAIPNFQRGSADAKITEADGETTCAPARRPVLSSETPILGAGTGRISRGSGLTQFAVEYWVHHEGLRVHHSGDDVDPDSSFESQKDSSSKWVTDEEDWQIPRDWINPGSQNLPLGTYTLDCALWGHQNSPAYKRLRPGNKAYEFLVNAVQSATNPIQAITELITGSHSPNAEIQGLEREISRWTTKDDYSLQGLVSTEFTVVEARWGTDGLSIERGIETFADGRERIRIRVNREEAKNRGGEPIPAPYFLIDGSELYQREQATLCPAGSQDHTTYLSRCWEITSDLPVNDTRNERKYTVTAQPNSIEGDQASSFTVEASPDAAALEAFYNATGGPSWVNKDGWLSNTPIGDWYGVETGTSGRVIGLDFRGSGRSGNGLQGSIPFDLKDTLPFLQTLYLEGNSGLTRCIPENLFDVLPNGMATLDLPTCEDTCAWGAALPDPNNSDLLADCEALLAARNSLTASTNSDVLDWSARMPIGDWRGVHPDGSPERVIRLEITQPPRLRGYLSAELGKLSKLQILNLSYNGLRGEIPEEVEDLTSLHTLILRSNRLDGGIPVELTRLINLRILDLSDNDLRGRIPRNLANLVNLQSLNLSDNHFTGCIPQGLRRVATNDFGDLGLPFCDVMLSGLTISTGTLTPQFRPSHTDYVVEVRSSPVTITPTNDHNARFAFLDKTNDALIPDADVAMAGHQVALDEGVTTIKVKVTSQDNGASHTYTIRVTTVGLPGAPEITGPITPGAASLTVSWTAPPGGTVITSYDLRYIESSAVDKADANWTVVEDTWTTGSLIYTIEGLTGGAQYDVQVRAVSSVGAGPWSVTATGTPVQGDQVPTAGATRSFSTSAVAPGGQLVVTITATGYGAFGGVAETLPSGFSYVSSSLLDDAVTAQDQELSFALLGETEFTYTVTAPDAAGSYPFSGILTNSDKEDVPVGGRPERNGWGSGGRDQPV